MELPQQRQRVVVDGLGKIGEIKENKTVESGISGKKHLSTLSNKVNLEYISSKEYHNQISLSTTFLIYFILLCRCHVTACLIYH